MKIKIITKNKKAYFNYEILDTIEAGIVLAGNEVKSIKNSQVNIYDAFVRIENNEAWLWNADIPLYRYSTIQSYDPTKRRKLLLKRREIDKLSSKLNTKGMTLVPTKVYLKNGKVKIEVGLARGKKDYQKKEKQKLRDLDRELHKEKRRYQV